MRLKMRSSTTSILCLAAFYLTAFLLKSNTASAQFPVQYTPPGGPQQQPESRQEELERALAEARYRLGPIRIAPWATLRDVAYVRSLVSSGPGQQRLPNDLTATVGAGFRAYLRNGSKATWTAQVLPEYAWWQKQTQRRQLNGRYLLGFNGYFNHLTVELQAGRQQGQQVVTPEVPVPVSTRVDGGELVLELRLSHALSLFTVTSFNRQNNLITDDPLTGDLRLLDRDERAERLGVRWRPEQRWWLALAGERSESDFTHQGALDRSNTGTAPVVEVHFRGNHLGFQADAANRSLNARRGAELVPFHGVTGNAALDVGGAQTRATATLYSSRTLDYSLSRFYSYLTDERLGSALTVGFGQRTRGRIFAERGRNDYTAFSAATPRRRDDVTSYGGSLIVELRRSLRVGIQGVRSRYDSNLPGASRSYTSVGATITLADIQ